MFRGSWKSVSVCFGVGNQQPSRGLEGFRAECWYSRPPVVSTAVWTLKIWFRMSLNWVIFLLLFHFVEGRGALGPECFLAGA